MSDNASTLLQALNQVSLLHVDGDAYSAITVSEWTDRLSQSPAESIWWDALVSLAENNRFFDRAVEEVERVFPSGCGAADLIDAIAQSTNPVAAALIVPRHMATARRHLGRCEAESRAVSAPFVLVYSSVFAATVRESDQYMAYRRGEAGSGAGMAAQYRTVIQSLATAKTDSRSGRAAVVQAIFGLVRSLGVVVPGRGHQESADLLDLTIDCAGAILAAATETAPQDAFPELMKEWAQSLMPVRVCVVASAALQAQSQEQRELFLESTLEFIREVFDGPLHALPGDPADIWSCSLVGWLAVMWASDRSGTARAWWESRMNAAVPLWGGWNFSELDACQNTTRVAWLLWVAARMSEVSSANEALPENVDHAADVTIRLLNGRLADMIWRGWWPVPPTQDWLLPNIARIARHASNEQLESLVIDAVPACRSPVQLEHLANRARGPVAELAAARAKAIRLAQANS